MVTLVVVGWVGFGWWWVRCCCEWLIVLYLAEYSCWYIIYLLMLIGGCYGCYWFDLWLVVLLGVFWFCFCFDCWLVWIGVWCCLGLTGVVSVDLIVSGLVLVCLYGLLWFGVWLLI